jgi:hypothetical protein
MLHRIESQFIRSIIVPKPSNMNFLIVVCDFEEDIAKSRTKASTIHPKSLNPNQQHDQHKVHKGEKTQTKLSRKSNQTPSTKRAHNDAAKSRRQAMQGDKR